MKGLIHIYTGDGKGKTTAAIGAGIRALGRGRKVLMVQFLKGWETGEVFTLKKLEPSFTLKRSEEEIKFPWQMDGKEKIRAAFIQGQLLEYAVGHMEDSNFDFIILDEIMACINLGFVDLDPVVKMLEGKPRNVEIIMTGRDAPLSLVERADYVSEIQNVKHPMDDGITARKGIEY